MMNFIGACLVLGVFVWGAISVKKHEKKMKEKYPHYSKYDNVKTERYESILPDSVTQATDPSYSYLPDNIYHNIYHNDMLGR